MGHGSMREDEEEDSSYSFFDAGEGLVIGGDYLSSRAASESGQSSGGTEDDPVGTVMASAGCTTTHQAQIDRRGHFITHNIIPLDDNVEEWVDPTPIPTPPLEPAPALPPPIIAET